MERNCPCWFIELLNDWCSKLTSVVRWGNYLSEAFKITSGVRQGTVSSPVLFAVCVDNLLRTLGKSKLGCYIKSCCFNSIMYADDLILISLSIRDLQSMLNICTKEFRNVGLSVNCAKTFCMRVGPKHSVEPNNIVLNSVSIPWVQEFTYLGITIVSANHFKN